MKKIPLIVSSVAAAAIIVILAVMAGNMSDKPDIIASGELYIDESLVEYAEPNRTLFIVLYDADPSARMPLGVMQEPIRVSGAGLIRKFSLTPEKLQRMMSNAPIPAKFRIKARLDRDGRGGVDQPGDVTAEVSDVAFGSDSVKIQFSKKI